MKQIAIGNDDFKDLRKEDCYFVDKTYFIKDIIDTKAKVTLITRPRRFGKTLNMSMLYYYFNCNKLSPATKDAGSNRGFIENNKNLFDDLFISKQEDKYLNECGKYPTIFITFRGMEAQNYDSAVNTLKSRISDEFEKHSYLLDNDKISERNKRKFNNFLNEISDEEEYKESLLFLSGLLEQHYGQKVIILIDEYDKPIQNSFLNDYYDRFVKIVKGLFENTFKTNPSLHKAIITGILRVAKEGIFSGLNNLEVHSITNKVYSNHFGFSQEEINEMFDYYGLEGKLEEASLWYNGYNYGGNTIYNPWSILNYCKFNEEGFKSYWVNSGSTDIIDLSVKNASNIRNRLVGLLDGIAVKSSLAEEMIYSDIKNCIEDSVYTLLLYSGYLNIAGKDEHDRYIMKIPNKEVTFAYKTMIERWAQNILNLNYLVDMFAEIFDGNLEPLKSYVNDTFLRSFSYFDQNKAEPEIVYQAFFMGLLTQLNSDLYIVRSNRESGFGRYAICVYPKAINKNKTGVIFEFKTTENIDDLEKNAKTALSQINTMKYETDLKNLRS